MRSGYRRVSTLALGLSALLALSVGARADGFHTIPRLVPAVDVNTGGEYLAPPVPGGHYTGKDCINKLTGKANGLLHGGLLRRGPGDGCGPCGGCGGRGCNACGGRGTLCGDGLAGGANGGGCGVKGCKLFHGGNGGACGDGNGGACSDGKAGCGLGHGHKHGLAGGGLSGGGCGLCGGKGCGSCIGHASTIVGSGQAVEYLPTPVASGQGHSPGGPVVIGDPACSDPGCKLFGHHKSKGCGLGSGISDPCNSCGGKGCGKCGLLNKLCGLCGGNGCGLCGGNGLGNGCGLCGGRGCGRCAGNGNGCGLCGGRGCNACARARGLVNKLLHKGNIKWFVGAGGPVPLTPGYTPYVVTTRSPRDFFAFPPMSDSVNLTR